MCCFLFVFLRFLFWSVCLVRCFVLCCPFFISFLCFALHFVLMHVPVHISAVNNFFCANLFFI